jgi:phage tail sheath protein FI
LNADVAGLCARTDNIADPWFSPAGLNRGNIKNTIALSNPESLSARNALYQIGVNPCVVFPTNGPVLFGDKTLQSKPSAFDRINVRRLFIVLEKSIATAAKFLLFEQNDAQTQALFTQQIEPFLRDVQARQGITDFRVVCNSTNNTPQVVDANQFVADLYIKPTRSINYIKLNFVAVATGVDFSEIVQSV